MTFFACDTTGTPKRQTWTSEDCTGTCVGGFSVQFSCCSPASFDGPQEEAGTLSVNQNSSSISLLRASASDTCSLNGTYTDTGKLGQANGSYSCAAETSGSFSAVEMNPTISGFTARISGQNQFCDWSGTFGGIRRAVIIDPLQAACGFSLRARGIFRTAHVSNRYLRTPA